MVLRQWMTKTVRFFGDRIIYVFGAKKACEERLGQKTHHKMAKRNAAGDTVSAAKLVQLQNGCLKRRYGNQVCTAEDYNKLVQTRLK